MKCSATTKVGRQCRNRALARSKFCHLHARGADRAKLRAEYQSLSIVSSEFAEALEEQLRKMIVAQKLALGVPIESRVKSWSSIAEKLERKALSISSLRELDDFIGVRLIFLFKRDLYSIHKLLSDAFEIVSHEDTSERLRDRQFGYQSLHYVVKLRDDWLVVPTMGDFGGLKAEIQVRTLSQHIWAAASHKLQYKHEMSVPIPIRRAIHRVSAILEVVDLEFERVLADRDEYMAALSLQEERPLDVDSLQSILIDQWPVKNSDEDELYSELLDELLEYGIGTTGALSKLIGDHHSSVLQHDQRQVKAAREGDEAGLEETTEERSERGVFFNLVGLTRVAMSHEFGTKWLVPQMKKGLRDAIRRRTENER